MPAKEPALTLADLEQGGVYVAKRFQQNGFGKNNNRQIIAMGHIAVWGDETWVQYDSDTVINGSHYPKTTAAKFLKWARRKLTDEEREAYFK